MYNHISWYHSQHREKRSAPVQDYKKAEVSVWGKKKSPWKEVFPKMHYLSKQTAGLFYPQFIDEETKNDLRPFPRGLIAWQNQSCLSIRGLFSAQPDTVPSRRVTHSWPALQNRKPFKNTIISSPFHFKKPWKNCVYTHAYMNTHDTCMPKSVCEGGVLLTNLTNCLLILNKWVILF